ncbi:hypothetical protein B0T10DRAFT_486754 [Thelonectria olida]|uniref:Uncharacterized protein n=1 Tax=Thelonectria olida TaxID=1576542 RepID=A0A9P9ASP4_9HYPO|nr:hypothetical protein B0T10DRAFT_486754 [Thelonectria olida]
MGILFSKLHGDNSIPAGAYTAGNASSINGSTIQPYLGINYGLYKDIPTSELPPIPFEWIVSPSNVTGTCPDASQILTMFAVTEAVIVLLTPLIAYRPFVHWLSRGRLGRREKQSILWTWIIVFGCQLLANASIAGMIGNTPGYNHLNMLHIFTLFMARPRYHLVVLGLLRSIVGIQRPRDWDKTKIIQHRMDDRIEFPYADAYIATTLSEMLLLIVAAVFTGVTWHRMPQRSQARELIDGIVSFVSSTPGVALVCALAFVPVFKRYGDAFPMEGRRYDLGRRWGVSVAPDGRARVRIQSTRRKRAAFKRGASAVAAAVLMGFVTLIQWSYWTMFLQMPGVLFCPPKMVGSGVIWAVFTVAGTLAGAAS